MSLIIENFRITYENGIKQEKSLVSKASFEEYKKLRAAIAELENKKKDATNLRTELKQKFGSNQLFVEGSPMHAAIETGMLAPSYPGGDEIKISFERI